jgi:hypothetical protein
MWFMELTLFAVRGFVVPDLTGTEHGVDRAGEASGGGDPSYLPAEALPGLFVGTREPAIRGVHDVGDHGPDEGAPEPAIGAGGNRSMSDRSLSGL